MTYFIIRIYLMGLVVKSSIGIVENLLEWRRLLKIVRGAAEGE